MSSAVVAEGHHPGSGVTGPSAMRNLLKFPDLIALAIALPVFILADWPLVGWAVAAFTWVGSSALILYMQFRATQATETRHQVGLVIGGSIARAWISAAGILVAYLIAGETAGLACALLMIGLFTIYFFNKMFTHLLTEQTPKA